MQKGYIPCVILGSLLLTGCSNIPALSGLIESTLESSEVVTTTEVTEATPVNAPEPIENKDWFSTATSYELTQLTDDVIKITSVYKDLQVNYDLYYIAGALTDYNITITTEKSSILAVCDSADVKLNPSAFELLSKGKYSYLAEDDEDILKPFSNMTYLEAKNYVEALTKVSNDAETEESTHMPEQEPEQEEIVKDPVLAGGTASPYILEYSNTKFMLEKTSMQVSIGETRQIHVAQCPRGYEDKLVWASSTPSVALVDQYGNVIGMSSGVSTINASIEGAGVYQSIIVYCY